MKTPILTVACLLGALSLSSVSAAVLAEYPFNSSGAGTGPTPITPIPNLVASDASWNGLGELHASQLGFGGSTGSAFVRPDRTSSAFNPSQYLAFTLSAADGYLLNLHSLEFDLGGSAVPAPMTVYAELRSSIDGFTNSLSLSPGLSAIASVIIPQGTSSPLYTSFSTEFSSEFLGLDEITFHLYVYDSSNSTSQTFLRISEISASGEVQAIPEPTTGLLILGAATCLLLRRRSFK